MLKLHRFLPLLLVAVIASAAAHGTVESAIPKNGATLETSPPEIRLKFGEPLEPTFTSVKLFGASGAEVAVREKARVEDGKTIVQPLPTLTSGAYRARWASVGHDGHPIHGDVTFTVK